jgi:hypothetical protein
VSLTGGDREIVEIHIESASGYLPLRASVAYSVVFHGQIGSSYSDFTCNPLALLLRFASSFCLLFT